MRLHAVMDPNPSDLTELQVAIRTCHGTYLRAHPGGEGAKLDTQTHVGPWEEWTLIVDDTGTKFSFRSSHSTYIRTHPGGEGSQVDMQTFIGPWEEYKLLNQAEPHCYAIQSIAHESFVRAHPGGEGFKVDTQTQIGPWEKYFIRVISQPVKVEGFEYNIDQRRMISQKPVIIAAASLSNDLETPVTLSHTFDELVSNVFTFKQTRGANISKTTMIAGIPFLFDGTPEITPEQSWSWGLGENNTTSQAVKIATQVTLQPHQKVKVILTGVQTKIEVPWTATSIYVIAGREIKKSIEGVWSGACIDDIKYTIQYDLFDSPPSMSVD